MTEYVKMLLASGDIPVWWGRFAHIFSWILLQGYVIFPSTFSNYSGSSFPQVDGMGPLSFLEGRFFYAIRHVPT